MKKHIDIQKILPRTGLSYKELAEELFPANAYPHLALRRIEKGEEKFLDEQQIRKLALLAKCSISELLGESEWKSMSEGHILRFASKDYKAELDKKCNTVKIFHKGTLFHEEILFEGCIRLSDFLNKLDELISNHSK